MTTAVLSPRARRDLLAAVRWIAKDNRSAARALRHAVASAAERIARHPEIGVVRLDILPEPYRFVTLSGFPYLIVDNAGRRPPIIICILHGARDLRRLVTDLEEPGDGEWG